MKINREIDQGGLDTAIERVSFCLDQLEKADRFNKNIDWDTEIVSKLTIEEIIGALISAEQQLEEFEVEMEEELDPHSFSEIET